MADESKGETIAARIARLVREIQRFDHEYYTLAKPTVTDLEYDRKLRELEILSLRFPISRSTKVLQSELAMPL